MLICPCWSQRRANNVRLKFDLFLYYIAVKDFSSVPFHVTFVER